MMRSRTLLLSMLLSVLFIAAFFVMFSADSDADVTLSGEVILTGDTVYSDGTVITIEDGTILDIGGYKFDTGKNSKVVLKGDVTIKIAGGKFVQGVGTKIQGDFYFIPAPSEDVGNVEYTYDGILESKIEGLLSNKLTVNFTPNADDKSIYILMLAIGIEQEICKLSLCLDVTPTGLLVFQQFASGTISTLSDFILALAAVPYASGDLTVNFTYYEITKTSGTEGSRTIKTTTFNSLESASKDTIELTISGTGLTFEQLNIISVSHSSFIESTGIRNTVTVEDLSITEMTISGDYILTTTDAARSITVERDVYGIPEYSIALSYVEASLSLDLKTIITLLIEEEEEIPEYLNAISSFTFRSEEVKMQFGVYATDIVKFSVDFKNDSIDNVTVISYESSDGDTVVNVQIDNTTFTTLTIDNGILNCVMNTETVTVAKQETGTVTTLSFYDDALTVDTMDLHKLAKAYISHGEITLQDLLDTTTKIEVSSETVDYSIGIMEPSATATKLKMILFKDNTLNTYTASIGSIKGTVYQSDDSMMDIDSLSTSVSIKTKGNMTTLIRALTVGASFEEDTHGEIGFATDGISLRKYQDGSEEYVSFGIKRVSGTDSGKVNLAVDYTVSDSKMKIVCGTDLLMFSTKFACFIKYTEPEGSMNVDYESTGMIGTFELIFSKGSDNTPIAVYVESTSSTKAHVNYYGIAYDVDTTAEHKKISNTTVDVKDYSYEDSGVLGLISAISESNFNIKLNSESNADRCVFTNLSNKKTTEYTNFSTNLTNMGISMVQGDHVTISLEKLHIKSDVVGGSPIDKTISNISITKYFNKVPAKEFEAPLWLCIFALIGPPLIGGYILYLKLTLKYGKREAKSGSLFKD